MSWLMRQASRLIPDGIAEGASDLVDAGSDLLDGIANSEVLDSLGPISAPHVNPLPLLTGLVADRDQEDGQQVFVADTGADMDLWSAVTGQEQADGGLSGIVDAVERNADGQPVDSVEFKSHGYENGQHVAAGSNLHGDLSKSDRAEFARLGELMDDDGEILMAGCNVGKDYTEHHAHGDSMLDDIAEASGQSVRAGVAIQLPFDGIEGSSVVVHPDGTYELDTSSGKQVYDVTADGLGALAMEASSENSWGESLSNGLGILGGMASDYWDIASDVWNGTHEAEGWDMLSPRQREEMGL